MYVYYTAYRSVKNPVIAQNNTERHFFFSYANNNIMQSIR